MVQQLPWLGDSAMGADAYEVDCITTADRVTTVDYVTAADCVTAPLGAANPRRHRQSRAMNRFAILVAACCCAALSGCGDAGPPAPVPVQAAWDLPTARVVEAALPVTWEAVGTVVSEARVEVASRTSGYIRDLHVHEGESVRAGQLLVTLDDSDIEAAVRQAQSAVAAAKAQLADARIDLARYQNLYAAGSIAEVQLRKARLHHDTLAEQLISARAGLKSARAQREYVRILSPTDGVIVARQRQRGDLAAPGVPILIVESAVQLLFATYVTDAYLNDIALGDAVAVRLDGTRLTGRVARIVPSSDPVTRKFEIKVALPADPALRPGSFGRAEFVLGTHKQPVIAPAWLVERGGLKGVFVVDAERRARFRWVRTQREWPDRIEVVAGLRPGEIVIAKSDPRLRDGDSVRPAATPQAGSVEAGAGETEGDAP